MITSITFQFSYNKNYIPTASVPKVYGESTIADLELSLLQDSAFLPKVHSLVKTLNNNLAAAVNASFIGESLDFPCRVTEKTKKKRSFYCAGLTIHEEDITNN